MNTYAARSHLISWLSAFALTVCNNAWAGTFATAAAPDTAAPVLTTPAVQSITGNSAVIHWGSNKVADSRVYFGTAAPLIKVAGEIEFATSHLVKLTKLLPNTSYSYQVVSVDPVGNKTTGAVLTFTTTNNTLTNQTINFVTVPNVQVGQSGMISALATSELDVVFHSATTGVCTVAANGQANQATVTGVSSGSCGIAANQAGNGTYAPAPEMMQYFNIRSVPSAPTPPTITSVMAGPGRVTISFTLPSSDGGAAITSYTATCDAANKPTKSATGTGTSIVVGGLIGGVRYSCTLTASNGSLSSTASVAATGIPDKAVDLTPILMLLLE